MKEWTCSLVTVKALVFLVAVSCANGQGILLALHEGTRDPASEGFAATGYGIPQVGPISADLGLASWFTRVSASSVRYVDTLPVIDGEDWVLTVSMRVVTPDQFGPHGVNVVTGQYMIGLSFGNTPEGDPMVQAGHSQSVTPVVVLTGAGASYHDYQLTYNAAAHTTSLWVDGVKYVDSFPAQKFSEVSTPALYWGSSFQSAAQKQANWHLISVQIIPEPSAFALLAVGGGWLWAARRRTT